MRYALSYATIKSECGVYGMLCTLLRWLCIFYYNCCRYIIFSCRICKWLKDKNRSCQIPWNCFRNLEYIYMYKPAKMLHQLASKLNHTTDALCLYYSQQPHHLTKHGERNHQALGQASQLNLSLHQLLPTNSRSNARGTI